MRSVTHALAISRQQRRQLRGEEAAAEVSSICSGTVHPHLAMSHPLCESMSTMSSGKGLPHRQCRPARRRTCCPAGIAPTGRPAGCAAAPAQPRRKDCYINSSMDVCDNALYRARKVPQTCCPNRHRKPLAPARLGPAQRSCAVPTPSPPSSSPRPRPWPPCGDDSEDTFVNRVLTRHF